MKCLRECFCWYLLFLAAVAPKEVVSGTVARFLPVRRGWAIPRGGSNEAQSSSENDSDGETADSEDEWEEEAIAQEVGGRDQTDAWSEDLESESDLEEAELGREETDTAGDDEDIDVFLDAQEFIEDESVAEETVQDELLDEEEEYEDDEEEFEGQVEEDVTPETDFETQELQQDVSTSTEDASQIEPEFSGEVETESGNLVGESETAHTGGFADEKEAVEFVEPTTRDPSQETAAVAMAETEATEEEAAFVAASRTAENIPTEMDLSQQHTTDDDSMAFEDRMQLADDEGEAVLSGFPDDEIMGADERVVNEAAAVDDIPSTPVNKDTTPSEEADVQVESYAAVDDETKRILIKELKFHRREVNGMKPEIAIILAEKRLRRPCEGIPPNWYTDEAKYKQSVGGTRHKNRILRIALLPIVYAVPIVLGGLAVYGSADLASMFSTLSSDIPEKVADDEEKEASTSDADETEKLSQPSSTGTGGIAPYDGTTIPKEENDTWLDKVITGIAKPLQALWNMKI